MSIGKHQKLHGLQRELPEGLLASSVWLKSKGYSDQLLRKYRHAGWLESPVRGVYRRPGPPLKWEHVVASLGRLLDHPLHVGGLSALELRGKAHFLKFQGLGDIHLYAAQPLPRWVHKLPLGERFVEHSQALFTSPAGTSGSDEAGAISGADDLRKTVTTEPWGQWDWTIPYSTPERAMLELLDEVPRRQSVEHAAEIFGMLTDLSSRRVLVLLKACRSIKVKRLFLALASRHAFHWVPPVVAAAEAGEVAIGSGKRMLVAGGRLDPKYLITLPGDGSV